MSRLIIAEKPSVAKSIAPVVKAEAKHNGYTEGNGYIVSWCFGHLVTVYSPSEYSEEWAAKWSFSQLPMLPEMWRFKVKQGCEAQFKILKELMNRKDIDEIICATDADREGECIFRYVYKLIGCKKPVKRLWVSSLEESAIKSALSSMKSSSEYDSLYSAGFCRLKADWIVGMNGTRLFSVRYNSKITVGRVQTPTLAMIVQRDNEVRNFVKQKFFTVDLNCGSFVASSKRIDDELEAEKLLALVNGKDAAVSELKKEVKTVNPPKLYDLTTLQCDANQYFGYTAQQTLDSMQKLYEAQLVTYPRTDSQYISDDMEETAMQRVSDVAEVFHMFGKPDSVNVKRCINNAKVSGHHAILPTGGIKSKDLNSLSEEENNILKLVSARLIMVVAEPQKYEAVKVTVTCENTHFTAIGKTVIKAGWKALETKINAALKNKDSDENEKKEASLPEMQQGVIFKNVSACKSEHWTSPPKSYTEKTLLKAMETAGNKEYVEDSDVEKKGLGTPATRAGIIEQLVRNGYVERKKKQLIATDKGIKIISVVPEKVKSAKLTADWETELQHIEKGSASAALFMSSIVNYTKEICKEYGQRDESVVFTQSSEREVIGKCPKCGKDVVSTAKAYSCNGGKDGCGFIVWKSIAEKNISAAQAKKLIGKRKTDLIKGFKSRSGKEFNAYLILKDDFSVGYEFDKKK